jgi:hypothetical protein
LMSFGDVGRPGAYCEELSAPGRAEPGPDVPRRPAAGYADFRAPVRGLYQAGSGTHGGGVTGIPGRNAVHQILADRRTERWRRRVPVHGTA